MMRAQTERMLDATIVNVSVPGIDPWNGLITNPQIWHIAFHQVPELPELLIRDHIEPYFDYFYEMLSGGPDTVPRANKIAHARAHAQPGALTAGLDWYRAFPNDAKVNATEFGTACTVPLLYVRGSKDPASIDTYVEGFRRAGIRQVQSVSIEGSGHFVAEEQPAALAAALAEFFER
jgi:pimeloyl-ACP methyl ester carboxylesterase